MLKKQGQWGAVGVTDRSLKPILSQGSHATPGHLSEQGRSVQIKPLKQPLVGVREKGQDPSAWGWGAVLDNATQEVDLGASAREPFLGTSSSPAQVKMVSFLSRTPAAARPG